MISTIIESLKSGGVKAGHRFPADENKRRTTRAQAAEHGQRFGIPVDIERLEGNVVRSEILLRPQAGRTKILHEHINRRRHNLRLIRLERERKQADQKPQDSSSHER